jgi:hypothetical protein
VLPVEILREAVESYAPYLQASGEMHDPVFGEPTQYGTPYHALCNAVLAREDAGGRMSAAYADRAVRGPGARRGARLGLSRRARRQRVASRADRRLRRRHQHLPEEGVVRSWRGT